MPPTSTDLERSLYDTAPAVWVEAQWNITPRLRVVPGLRFDYYHVVETDKFSYDPRLALRWELTPRFALKAAVGLYHQLPNPEFLDRQFGNPNLLLSWADQYQIGVEQKFTDADELTATAFFVRRHDLPVASVDHFSSVGQGTRLRPRAAAAATPSPSTSTAGSRTRCRDRRWRGGSPRACRWGWTACRATAATCRWRPGQFDQTHNLIARRELPLPRLGDGRRAIAW